MVESERLHAYAVAENSAARKRTRRINGDNADALVPLPVGERQLVNERGFASAGRACDAYDGCAPSAREDCLHQLGGILRPIFNLRNCAGNRAWLARNDALY